MKPAIVDERGKHYCVRLGKIAFWWWADKFDACHKWGGFYLDLKGRFVKTIHIGRFSMFITA